MLEYLLAAVLIGGLPAWGLYRSLRRVGGAKTDRCKRYFLSYAMIGVPLLLLGFCWWHAARAPALLGLDIPVSLRGMIGLAIAAALFVGLVVVEFVNKRKGTHSDEALASRKLESNDLMPRTHHELVLFLGVALLAGCGWELLYRGFLMWLLVPRVGTVAAICIAAVAYGVAHGGKSRGQVVATLVSAFAFTIAFVLTASLWWLMLIHSMIGIASGAAAYKLTSRQAAGALPDAEPAGP